LADYQMQTLDGIPRWHAVVFLTLAYLQRRQVQVLAQPRAHEQPTLAGIIETHRHKHIVEWQGRGGMCYPVRFSWKGAASLCRTRRAPRDHLKAGWLSSESVHIVYEGVECGDHRRSDC
jgi:hypothetical protein